MAKIHDSWSEKSFVLLASAGSLLPQCLKTASRIIEHFLDFSRVFWVLGSFFWELLKAVVWTSVVVGWWFDSSELSFGGNDLRFEDPLALYDLSRFEQNGLGALLSSVTLELKMKNFYCLNTFFN